MRRSAMFAAGMFLTLLAVGYQALAAQEEEKEGVRFETITSFEFGGAMGDMMRMVPGAQTETRQTTIVSGANMRTDSDDESTIFNFSNPTSPLMTVLQHPERTFYSLSVEEMQERMGAAMAGARQEELQWEERGGERPEFDIKFSMNPTGRSKEFGEYSADEVVTVVEMVPTGDAAQAEAASTMAVVTKMLVSEDFPGHDEIREAQKKMAEGYMGGGGMGTAFQQAFASDPRMKDMFEENAEKMKDMDGVPVETIVLFVNVPFGAELDVEAVLAAADKPLSDGPGMGGIAAEGARAAARDAMKNISGLLGRKNKEQEEPGEEAGPATQTITMKSVSTIEGVTVGPVSQTLFKPTEGYVEKVPEWLRRGGGF